MRSVGIVGAGPAGLVAARFLANEGFEPVLFEQGDRIGGQWTGDARYSGIWPSMRTNSSRLMTCFSDLPHPANANVYLTHRNVAAYLKRYAEQFGVLSRVRLKTCVQCIDRDASGRGWSVRYRSREGPQREGVFERVGICFG